MRRALRLLVAPLVLASALLVGCGYQPGYGNRYPDDGGYPRDTYPSGRYDARRVAVLPGGGEVVRQNGRLVVIDRNGRRYDYGSGRAEVCHRGRTQRVSDRSVQGHLRHGDRFGSCRNGYSSGGYGYGNDGYYDDGYYDDGGYRNGGYSDGRTNRTRGYEGPIQRGSPRGATSGTGEVAPSSGKNGRADGRGGSRHGSSGTDRSGNDRSAAPRTTTPDRTRSDNGRASSPRTGRSQDSRSEDDRSESGRNSSDSGRSSNGGRGKTGGN